MSETTEEGRPTGALARYCPCGHTANYHRGTPELAKNHGCSGTEGNRVGEFGVYHCRCSATIADVIAHGFLERPEIVRQAWSA